MIYSIGDVLNEMMNNISGGLEKYLSDRSIVINAKKSFFLLILIKIFVAPVIIMLIKMINNIFLGQITKIHK